MIRLLFTAADAAPPEEASGGAGVDTEGTEG
jgi:hypothetical protein